MQADVDRLVARAGEMDRLWPWMAADREIDRVVRHGKAIAPLLVAFLAEDPHEPPLEMADPNDALRAALAQLGAAPAGVRIEQDLAPAASLLCDSAGLERVALALLKNACGAMRGRSGAVRLASAAGEREWQFSVSDDGAGIDEATQARMFDPFFTTADVGGGMGLGLTLAADIVRFHRGRIEVRSAPGEGSTFTVRIPRGAGGPA
jgi:signal transduction histidine kinase